MIRYLEKDEYRRCLPLWREAFPEDSERFLTYYFEKKAVDSRVLVKEENGRILTMAFLNPYKIRAGSCLWKLDYIVGVATALDSRHQGHMRELLARMLKDMNREGTPFCYLMPASASIYRPFEFEFIFDQPGIREDEKALSCFEKRKLDLDENPACLAEWMNLWLQKRFEVYAVRNEAYIRLLKKELDSEEGEVYGWFDRKEEMQAVKALWGMKKTQRFLYCKEDSWAVPENRDALFLPGIMARITNIVSMIKPVTLKSDCPCSAMEVPLMVRDKLLSPNAGMWKWAIDQQGARLWRISNDFAEEKGESEQFDQKKSTQLVSSEVLDITITQLVSWLFGYKKLQDLLSPEQIPFWCNYIKTLDGVFLDEVV